MRARLDSVVAGPSGRQVVDREADVAGPLGEVARDEAVRVVAPIVAGMGHCGNDETGLGERGM